MYSFNIPESKIIRVILDTDLKNEVDDQFAVVHALLTQSFDLKGIIPAHFGEKDSPAIGVMMYPDCGKWADLPAPAFDDSMHYIHHGLHRPIRVYESIDARFILEDFYAKIKAFSREKV